MKQNKLFNILRNFIEQVNKWQATLYLNFIDFEIQLYPPRKHVGNHEEIWSPRKRH